MPIRTPGPNADAAYTFALELPESQAIEMAIDLENDPFMRVVRHTKHDTLDLGVFWVEAGERHTWPVRVFQIDAHTALGTESRCVYFYLNPTCIVDPPIVQVQDSARINPKQADGHPEAGGLVRTRSQIAPAHSGA